MTKNQYHTENVFTILQIISTCISKFSTLSKNNLHLHFKYFSLHPSPSLHTVYSLPSSSLHCTFWSDSCSFSKSCIPVLYTAGWLGSQGIISWCSGECDCPSYYRCNQKQRKREGGKREGGREKRGTGVFPLPLFKYAAYTRNIVLSFLKNLFYCEQILHLLKEGKI